MQTVLDWLKSISENSTNLIVYGAIIIVTLIGVFKCLVPLWGTTHALRHAIKRLQSEAGEQHDVPVWQERRFCGRRLKGIWLRFLQNAEQLDRRGLPCNVEDYINDDTVTHGPGNATLAEMIPNLLTSLGILGTFLGMTAGLGAIKTDAMMEGINDLLSGMSFAFGTSVAGVSCSIVFNMLNRIAQGSSYRAIDEFVESFTQLAMQRPLDNDVQQICQNQDRNHLLSEVKDSMSSQLSQLPGAIQTAIGHGLQPVTASMDRFLVGATRAQMDGVARIVDRFIMQMNDSLNDQFYELGETMTSVNQQQAIACQQVQQALGGTHQMMTTMQQVNTVSLEVLDRFEHFMGELTNARNRDERFEASVSELMEKLRSASEQQSAMIETIRTNQAAVADASGRYMKQASDSLTGLADTAKTVQDAGRELSKTYADFTGQVTSGMNETIQTFGATMNQTLSSLSQQLTRIEKAGSGAEAARLNDMQHVLSDIHHAIEKGLPGGSEA